MKHYCMCVLSCSQSTTHVCFTVRPLKTILLSLTKPDWWVCINIPQLPVLSQVTAQPSPLNAHPANQVSLRQQV